MKEIHVFSGEDKYTVMEVLDFYCDGTDLGPRGDAQVRAWEMLRRGFDAHWEGRLSVIEVDGNAGGARPLHFFSTEDWKLMIEVLSNIWRTLGNMRVPAEDVLRHLDGHQGNRKAQLVLLPGLPRSLASGR